MNSIKCRQSVNSAWKCRSSILFAIIAGLLSACSGGSKQADATKGIRQERSAIAECLINDGASKAYGDGLHQPASTLIPRPAASGPLVSEPSCNGNREFRFAAARYDITGQAGGKIHMGNEDFDNFSTGVHMRQYARSYIIESPCNGKRVLIQLLDAAMVFGAQREALLQRIADDPDLAPYYNRDNVMVSATHTHSGPSGQAHQLAHSVFRLGYDDKAFQIHLDGMFESIKQAHYNFENNAENLGEISIAQEELLGANKSRAIPAYLANPEAERARYVDDDNNDVYTNRLMSLLKLERNNGKEVGSMNWFAIHPTAMTFSEYGRDAVPISGDSKGFGHYLFERLWNDTSDANQLEPFVSAFMQTDEGDSFSSLWFDDPEMLEANKHLIPNHPAGYVHLNGTAQLGKALDLYSKADEPLVGAVDYRFGNVKMDAVTVVDPVVIGSLQHPAQLDAELKQTCAYALGPSLEAGGKGPAPGERIPDRGAPAGLRCGDTPDFLKDLIADFTSLPNGGLPLRTFSNIIGCNLPLVPLTNLQCHAEKPILLPLGPPLNAVSSVMPFHLVRLGNLALIGLPWEITTMAGRRIRETVLKVLKDDGVDYVIINGLANDYAQYLTTREEYSIQQYEGASNGFGPWTLAAVQQELRRLALDMVAGNASDTGPNRRRTTPLPGQLSPPQGSDFTPPGSDFGDVTQDVEATYVPGDLVRVDFQASNPNSDPKTNSSFVFVERQDSNGDWQTVFTDADPETIFYWRSDTDQPQFAPTLTSIAEISWYIPRNTETGVFRIRFENVANTLGVLRPYEGRSREFNVTGPTTHCP